MRKLYRASGVIAATVINIPASILSRRSVELGDDDSFKLALKAAAMQGAYNIGALALIAAFTCCCCVCVGDQLTRVDKKPRRNFSLSYLSLSVATVASSFILNYTWTDDSVRAREVNALLPVGLLLVALTSYKAYQCVERACRNKPPTAMKSVQELVRGDDAAPPSAQTEVKVTVAESKANCEDDDSADEEGDSVANEFKSISV